MSGDRKKKAGKKTKKARKSKKPGGSRTAASKKKPATSKARTRGVTKAKKSRKPRQSKVPTITDNEGELTRESMPEKSSPEKTYPQETEREPVVQEKLPGETDLHQKALNLFFASREELTAIGSMSLDLYRDQLDSRLRAEGIQEYLSFVLADENYAVNIFHIKEIIKPPMITEVPRTEPVILGILSLRGTIAPVVDLRRRLRLEAKPQDRKSRVLIVEIMDGLVGLLVDEVRHVIRLKDEDIEPPPAVFDRAEAEHIVGVGRQEEEIYTLLELESVAQIDRFIKAPAGGRVE